MHTVLLYLSIGFVVAYFVAFGIVLIMGLFDVQKDSTLDNKIVVMLLILVLLVVPAFGVISYLGLHS